MKGVIRLIEINYTGWKFYDEMLREFCVDDDYYIYQYGELMVPTSSITGLSFPDVLSQRKLFRLYHSILEYRYRYKKKNHLDLHLLLFPNGEYSAASGGIIGLT